MAGSGCSSSPDDEAEDGLLGTPTSRMWKGAGPQGGPTQIRNKARGLIEAQVMDLLPTPVAQPSGNSPEDHLRKKPGREVVTDLAIIAENGLIESGGRLLPTPRTSDTNGPGLHGTGGMDLRTAATLLPTTTAMDYKMSGGAEGSSNVTLTDALVRGRGLLPTPTVGNADGTNERRGGSRSDELLLPGAAKECMTSWGPYEPAIRRWETVLGRPAPSPTEPNKNGNPRLSPKFTEWMMGAPEGWITGIPISRNEQLKACGNGVVRQQAAAALGDMLAAFGEAP